MKSHGREHYQDAGRKGAQVKSGLIADGRAYRELRDLGLLPSEERIERARRKAARK